MSDDPTIIDPPGASVSTVENPHTDPVTVAHAAHDSAVEILDGSDDEIARMAEKVARAKDDWEAAKGYLEDARNRKAERVAAVKQAHAELVAVQKDHPELAEQAKARRDTATTNRRNQLEAELARLTKGN